MKKLSFIIMLSSISLQAFSVELKSVDQTVDIAGSNVIVKREVNRSSFSGSLYEGWPISVQQNKRDTFTVEQLQNNRKIFTKDLEETIGKFTVLSDGLDTAQESIITLISNMSSETQDLAVSSYNFIKRYEEIILELFSEILNEDNNLIEVFNKKNEQIKALKEGAKDIKDDILSNTITPASDFIDSLLKALQSNDEMLKYYLMEALSNFRVFVDKRANSKNTDRASCYKRISEIF